MNVEELVALSKDTHAKVFIEYGNIHCQVVDSYKHFLVDLDTLRAIKSDRDKIFATLHGVTLEHYLGYKKWMKQAHGCMALTKQGQQCKSLSFKTEEICLTPAEWDPSKKVFCAIHKDWAMNVNCI